RIARVLHVGEGLRAEKSRGSDGEDAQDSDHRQSANKGSHECLLSFSIARTGCRIRGVSGFFKTRTPRREDVVSAALPPSSVLAAADPRAVRAALLRVAIVAWIVHADEPCRTRSGGAPAAEQTAAARGH